MKFLWECAIFIFLSLNLIDTKKQKILSIAIFYFLCYGYIFGVG